MKPGIAERNEKIINRIFEVVKQRQCTYTEAFEIVSVEERQKGVELLPDTVSIIFYQRENYGLKKV